MAGDTLSSISDLLGLNSPRGLLNFGNFSNGVWTPPASSANLQVCIISLNFKFDDFYYVVSSKRIKIFSFCLEILLYKSVAKKNLFKCLKWVISSLLSFFIFFIDPIYTAD